MKQGLSINIEEIKKNQNRAEDMLITQAPSPSIISAKKRKARLSNRKNNEQLIQDAQQDLLSYVDTVQNQVQDIIKTYQSEFLGAYKQHMKRIRQQMQDIKRRSMNNASSQRVHLDKIALLEKQLIIFRQESLKLFQKMITKDKEIQDLKFKIKLLQSSNKQHQKSMYLLAKKNKELEVALTLTKQQQDQLSQRKQLVTQKQSRQSLSENKNYLDFNYRLSKQYLLDNNTSRPGTTQLPSKASKNLSLKVQSSKKGLSPQIQDLIWFKNKIQQKIGSSKLVPVDTVLDIIAQTKPLITNTKRAASSQYKMVRSSFIQKIGNKRRSQALNNSDLLKFKSKQMASTNQLKQIFKNCVEQIKKNIIRRNSIPSLNFFKQNGPKNYLQFKKVDHFSLFQLLLKDESILKGLFSLIFNKAQ